MAETIVTRAENYNPDGVSHYYRDNMVSRSMTCKRLCRSRQLRIGTINDLRLIDLDNYGCPEFDTPQLALDQYIRTEYGERNVPVYIFDDHNHAFFAWLEALNEGRIDKKSILYHYDDHSDGNKVSYIPQKHDLKTMAQFAQSLEFDSFVHPAMELNVVDQVYWISYRKWERKKFEDEENHWGIALTEVPSPIAEQEFNPASLDPQKTIVDIDLDYFQDIDIDSNIFNEEIEHLRRMMNSAGVVTIATSPGIMDQQKALNILRILFDKTGPQNIQ